MKENLAGNKPGEGESYEHAHYAGCQPDAITLCLINYNGLGYLRQAFAAIRSLSYQFDEILVVDNASTDGSLAYLDSLQDVKVIALSNNTGPAGARNTGFLQAKNNIILFQDNDIRLTDGVVEGLYDALHDDEQALIAMPRVVYESEPEVIQYEGADCHVIGMMLLRQAGVTRDQASDVTSQTTSMVSACFMIDRARYQGDTLFDEGLIFNLEDHELGVRVNMLGYNTLVVPGTAVIHGGGTQGLSYRPGSKVYATRMYCLIRNRWWIIWRYYSLRSLLILAPLLLLFELWQLFGLILKGWGREWWRALVDTLRHFAKLCDERKRYQVQRQRSDADILRLGELPFTQAMNSNIVTRIVVKTFESIMYLYWHLVKGLL